MTTTTQEDTSAKSERTVLTPLQIQKILESQKIHLQPYAMSEKLRAKIKHLSVLVLLMSLLLTPWVAEHAIKPVWILVFGATPLEEHLPLFLWAAVVNIVSLSLTACLVLFPIISMKNALIRGSSREKLDSVARAFKEECIRDAERMIATEEQGVTMDELSQILEKARRDANITALNGVSVDLEGILGGAGVIAVLLIVIHFTQVSIISLIPSGILAILLGAHLLILNILSSVNLAMHNYLATQLDSIEREETSGPIAPTFVWAFLGFVSCAAIMYIPIKDEVIYTAKREAAEAYLTDVKVYCSKGQNTGNLHESEALICSNPQRLEAMVFKAFETPDDSKTLVFRSTLKPDVWTKNFSRVYNLRISTNFDIPEKEYVILKN